MKPESKRTGLLCRGLLAGLFFWAGLGGSQGQTPGLTYPVPIDEEHFPDAVFRNIVDDYDNDGNGSLSVEECGDVTKIGDGYYDRYDNLEGIRYFYALDTLYCGSNDLTSLDVSGLTALTCLKCWSNKLTSLDVSGCTALTYLDCGSNDLTSLDVSSCTALTYLDCGSNDLTSLDVSGCAALTYLDCWYNKLASLNVSGLTGLTYLDCSDNDLRTSLDVSGLAFLTELDCSGNYFLTSLDARGCIALRDLDCWSVETVDVSGCIALSKLYCAYSALKVLNVSGCTALEALNCSSTSLMTLDVSTCTSLKTLNCRESQLTFLDVSGLAALDTLDCCFNKALKTLNVRGCTTLTSLDVSGCTALTSLDVSGLTGLTELDCSGNRLTSLDVSGCTALRNLDCSFNYNALTSLDVSGCTSLETLRCLYNALTSLDVSGLTGLTYLDCGDNDLTSLDVSGLAALTHLDYSGNKLKSLDVSGLTGLTYLDCGSNDLTSLDVSGLTALTYLDYSDNKLTSLDVSGLTGLTYLNCGDNDLTSLDVSSLTALTYLDCHDNHLMVLDLSQCAEFRPSENSVSGQTARVIVDNSNCVRLPDLIRAHGGDMDRVHIENGGAECTYSDSVIQFLSPKSYFSYSYHTGKVWMDVTLTPDSFNDDVVVALDEANFPDEIFRTYVSEHLDSSANGYLDGKEATIKVLDVSGLGIRDLKGIEHFTSLESLDCSDNQLSSLDLSLNTKLTELDATGNVLKVSLDDFNRLDFSLLPGFDPAKASDWTGAQEENGQLQFLQAEVSYAYETGYQGEAELPEVRFRLDAGNGEAEIALSEANFPDAVFRSHVGGQIDRSGNDSLDIVERGNVRVLEVPSMGIQDLRGIGYFNKLENLDCSGNELTSLDLSGNPELRTLNATGNRLDITLGASNGFDLSLLPGFDLAKASGWEGGTRLGNILTFSQREVTYAYATGYNGSTEDESLSSVRFSLRADRDPGVANESMATKPQGKVYAKEHVIYIEGIEGEISVFTPSGMLLYQGHGKEIPVRNDGLYIVRSGQQVWKVLVM